MLPDQVYHKAPYTLKNATRFVIMKALRPRMIEHFSEFIKRGDLVFDIGANVGDLTQVFIELGANVVCLDPHPYCVAKLKKRFANNKRVTIIAKGVNHRNGELPFYTSSKSPASSTFSNKFKERSRYKKRSWEQKIIVHVTTFDSLVEQFGIPQFCKVDVEGYEPKVILGMQVNSPYISFEFLQEFLDDAKKCAAHLSSLGKASYNYSIRFQYNLRSEKWLTQKELFEQLEKRINGRLGNYLNGDIYVKFI